MRVARYLLLLILALPGCAPVVSALKPTTPACPDLTGVQAPITWLAAASPSDVERSRTWCESVGPVVVREALPVSARPHAGAVFVVNWNVAIGAGRVEDLIRRLVDDERAANRPEPDFILLLQEAWRLAGGQQPNDVLSLSTRLGMNVVYLPSMRNGRMRATALEDRGNAILSTLPLRDITAIELPFVRQRRVAVAAGVDVGGARLTVVSVHLDTRQTFLRGSLFSAASGRARQAAGLLEGIAALRGMGPVIVGGDFNTFGGRGEPALRLMERQFAHVSCGSPITHRWGLALDHVFASEASLVEECSRVAQRFGSDHHPLVVRVSRPAATNSE